MGDNIALCLTYKLAAESAGLTYKTLNIWLNRGKTEKSGKYYHFAQYTKKRNADAAKAGYTRICLWILERRFSADFGRRVYRKTNVVAENRNQNVEIIRKDGDGIRKEILAKFARIGEMPESLTD
jgi:hypothetical protein